MMLFKAAAAAAGAGIVAEWVSELLIYQIRAQIFPHTICADFIDFHRFGPSLTLLPL